MRNKDNDFYVENLIRSIILKAYCAEFRDK